MVARLTGNHAHRAPSSNECARRSARSRCTPNMRHNAPSFPLSLDWRHVDLMLDCFKVRPCRSQDDLGAFVMCERTQRLNALNDVPDIHNELLSLVVPSCNPMVGKGRRK